MDAKLAKEFCDKLGFWVKEGQLDFEEALELTKKGEKEKIEWLNWAESQEAMAELRWED